MLIISYSFYKVILCVTNQISCFASAVIKYQCRLAITSSAEHLATLAGKEIYLMPERINCTNITISLCSLYFCYMLKIHYPEYRYRIKEEDKKEIIFDEVRKKWVALTPEEWVRQNFVQYLIQQQAYPSSLIGIEKMLMLNDVKKRCDILIYKNQAPAMLVECKEMQVDLTPQVIQQILTYNMAIPVRYLCITNGSYCYAWERTGDALSVLENFPSWGEL